MHNCLDNNLLIFTNAHNNRYFASYAVVELRVAILEIHSGKGSASLKGREPLL